MKAKTEKKYGKLGVKSKKSAPEELKVAINKWSPALSHEDSDLLVELGWNSLWVGGFTDEQAESLKNTLLEFARVEAIKELKKYDKVRVEIDNKVVGIATIYTEKKALWAIFKDYKIDNFKLSNAIKCKKYNLTKID